MSGDFGIRHGFFLFTRSMETLLSISFIVAAVLWAGLALASLLVKLVAGILPLMKGNASGGVELAAGEQVPEEKELSMVA